MRTVTKNIWGVQHGAITREQKSAENFCRELFGHGRTFAMNFWRLLCRHFSQNKDFRRSFEEKSIKRTFEVAGTWKGGAAPSKFYRFASKATGEGEPGWEHTLQH